MHQPMRFAHCQRLFLKLGLAVALELTIGMGSASAAMIAAPDPTTLHIGGAIPTTAGDPNQIGDSGLVNIYQNQGSADNLYQPWLLILAIANDPTYGTTKPGTYFGDNTSQHFTNPIMSVTSTNPYNTGTSSTTGNTGQLGGTDLYGSSNPYNGTWNTKTGFVGFMDSSSYDAYTMIFGKTNLTNSNSFVNLQTAEYKDNSSIYSSTSNPVTNFGLYVFEITAPLLSNGVVGVQFSSLPQGTFAIAMGEIQSARDNMGNITVTPYDTPFTEAGLTTNASGGTGPGGGVVPAPPSVFLLCLGGLALAGFMARSRRRLLVAA
jgi:hypothetical protein